MGKKHQTGPSTILEKETLGMFIGEFEDEGPLDDGREPLGEGGCLVLLLEDGVGDAGDVGTGAETLAVVVEVVGDVLGDVKVHAAHRDLVRLGRVDVHGARTRGGVRVVDDDALAACRALGEKAAK